MTVEEIYQNRDAFASKVQEVAAGDIGKRIPVLINLFHGHGYPELRANDPQAFAWQCADFILGLAEKLFRGGADGYVVALDLDFGPRRPLLRAHPCWYRLPGLHVDGQQFEREEVTFSSTGITKVPPPLTMRKPTVEPSSRRCFRPDTMSTWLGPTLVYRLRNVMKMMTMTTATMSAARMVQAVPAG